MNMELAKFNIYVLKSDGNLLKIKSHFEVLYNPKEISITKSGWNSSTGQGGNNGPVPSNAPTILSVNFFFDTSLPTPLSMTGAAGTARLASTALFGRSSLGQLSHPEDVRKYTRQITRLTDPLTGETQTHPPICQLQWGKWGGESPKEGYFQGLLTSVTQQFTRFLPDGTPTRATLDCKFDEWEQADYKRKKLNPIDDPVRIVKRGETLSSIAQEEYGDPALWRIIAKENRLINPRAIAPGDPLTVPPLRVNTPSRRSI